MFRPPGSPYPDPSPTGLSIPNSPSPSSSPSEERAADAENDPLPTVDELLVRGDTDSAEEIRGTPLDVNVIMAPGGAGRARTKGKKQFGLQAAPVGIDPITGGSTAGLERGSGAERPPTRARVAIRSKKKVLLLKTHIFSIGHKRTGISPAGKIPAGSDKNEALLFQTE